MPIRIPEPCTEDWSKMTGTDKGAFCNKCAKEVIDFTAKTPKEIATILSSEFQSGKEVCGRIRQSQMNTLNDEDFVWQSEKQRFQVVWMFSIVAVFGLTLFSCQNTTSKELVEQMRVDAQEILAQENENESDSSSNEATLDKENDTLKYHGFDIRNEWPLESVWMGTVPYDYRFIGTGTECILWIGDLVQTYGVIQFDPPEEEIKQAFQQFEWPIYRNNQSPIQERVAPRPVTASTRNDIVYNEDFDDFIAYISTVPIAENSRIIVEVFRSISLKITLQNKDTEEIVGTRDFEFEKANYGFNPNFMQLEKGNYSVSLESENTRQTIPFSIAATDPS